MMERERRFGVKAGGRWVRDFRKDGSPIYGRKPYLFYDSEKVRECVTAWADEKIGAGGYKLRIVW